MEIIYFETSEVNYIYDNVFNNSREFGSAATKKLQLEKGRKWQISNITLWEIFLTKDEKRRRELFDFSRYIFYDTLISGPEEIIINYIKNGCPILEKPYELVSNSLFSKEWTIACQDFEYGFEPNLEEHHALTSHLRFLGEYFVKTEKGYKLNTYNKIDDISGGISTSFFKHIYEKLLVNYDGEVDDEIKNFIAYSIQIVMLILCYGIGFDQTSIELFWNEKTKPLERLEAAVEEFPEIFFRGPLANVTKMVVLQSKNQTGRGMYFDSLHSIYTTYSDFYVTNDEHFMKFKKENDYDPNMYKIISAKDLNFRKQ